MKALILNSGLGSRMGALTHDQPKCMTKIFNNETILSRQLKQIIDTGISEVVMTVGAFEDVLVNYCMSLELPIHISFVKNPQYAETNYIYSIFCAKDLLLDDDIVLMHGDLVFEDAVFDKILSSTHSCMAISTTLPLPPKDFKAVVQEQFISKIGIEFFSHAVAAQPLYKILKNDWAIWLDSIIDFCQHNNVKCYAENALNEKTDFCKIAPVDFKNLLCNEIDTPEDLLIVSNKLAELAKRKVYMCFSTDMIHGGHIEIIKKAARIGQLTVGVLSDEVVVSYKRFPLLPCSERKALFENINGINNVIIQDTLSYQSVLHTLQPDIVVHGDDWQSGFQKPIRDEVVSILAEYGGRLVEFPYNNQSKYQEIEKRSRVQLSIPDIRRGRLRKLLSVKPVVTIIEAHSGITGLIAEKTTVLQDGKSYQFDGMWVSSLCDSTAKGKPDIELVDMSSRIQTINDIMEVTTKPIILDGDTGGLTEHFVYNVRTLERLGVSAVIIEDKTGLKKNSLFGTEVAQTQDSIENFSAKISAGKKAQKTSDFMIIARIESLILERGMEDALMRAFAFVSAGADGIMIHSRKKDPSEIFEFVEKFRAKDSNTPIVVVPSSFNSVTEEEFAKRGVNIVIYANQLTRSGFPAMQRTAETILTNHRAKEADEQYCMSLKQILTLIPEE